MLDKSPQTIRRLFDQIAPRYDLINHSLSLGLDFSWRRRAVELAWKELQSEPLGAVLDVCCGTGDFSIAWHRKLATATDAEIDDVPSEASDSREANSRWFRDRRVVVGIDFSPAMLEVGRRKIQKIHAEKSIVLWQGDALALPFEDGTFAAVSVGFGLRNTVDPDRGLAEMVRVVRPGGVVAILDFDLPHLPILGPMYRFYLTKILPCVGKWISRNRDGAYHYFAKSVLQFEKGESQADKLRQAGLQDVCFKRMTCGVVSLYLGRRPLS
ncbi:MAG: bifunctional demethylmenaquinone methyltransferase/2-methoxy-6-polyprenyl-1,4-benzoquinol methylase UbiE [Planctomycetaceae bacterium]|nr:bifunctional demethylmenaquinone methyltransferase/2-methoxy-6-polyprenyl-1,4-benzoquinol methylase UbiE [Planctomycetaceae bacterium]MCL2305604.1 bifunctional demethylmenaquinone methyltransferase/2-methoxy-6-polyprenyl-1,4-benzoquinol methylase UbiE [Planctomycetaceae bacterium]